MVWTNLLNRGYVTIDFTREIAKTRFIGLSQVKTKNYSREVLKEFIVEKNKEIIYLKDGTFLECDKVHKGAYIWEPTFPLITLYIGCGDKTVEYDKIEKIIYSDGSTKFEGELMRTSNKIKFWYYTATTSIIAALVLLSS